ncbi:MAG: ABC transporter permease [Planctomycetaceae bacterium]|nr:ABC transporter permease [Planctomycetaceae bacterium]
MRKKEDGPQSVANPLGGMPSPHVRRFRALRGDISAWQAFLLGSLCIAVCGGIWWALTRGPIPEERIMPQSVLPSPYETFSDFHDLWFERALTRNTLMSLKRVILGFGLAAIVGIPLGVLCGCFRRVSAFFAPLMIVGRNIPIAAVIPLTLSLFGIGEFQKIMFIFIACVAFIVMDAATAIADVSSRYVDTAYTLGARRRQIIIKVLVPLAMPAIFNSLRLLFGLAFGYIMLAEVIQTTQDVGGLGSIINMAQRRGLRSDILLVLMLIPLVALGIDRLLFWVQRQLFPYQYGGDGLLHRGVRAFNRAVEDFVTLFRRPTELAAAPTAHGTPPAAQDAAEGGKPS